MIQTKKIELFKVNTKLMHKNTWLEPLMFWQLWGPPTVMSVILIIIAQYSFLGFHTLAELFAIVISFVIFAFAWSTYSFSKNNFLLFLACGYFWIGSLDLIHALVYKGMYVFVEGSGNLSVQFWIAARYSEALLLFAAPFAASKKQNSALLFTFFGAGATILISLIWSGKFPDGFIEGKGLTDFKIYGEYLIIFILVMALISLNVQKRYISMEERVLITFSIIITMCAELVFTFYVSVFDFSNLAGHIFKLFSFWFIFQAIVNHNLKKPFIQLEGLHKYNRGLFESLPIGLAVSKMDGTLVDVNDAYAQMIGYSTEEALTLSYWQLTPENYLPEEQLQLDSLRRTGKYGPFVKEYIHKDGHLVPAQLTGSIIEIEGERMIWSSVEDISKRKQLEAQLQQAQKMEAIGQLTGGIAHDFNNLLGIMMVNTELLELKVGKDEKKQLHIDTIIRTIDRASSLTQRLLAFSRQQPLTPKIIDINKFLLSIEDMLRRTLGETVELKMIPSPNLWVASVDSHQLDSTLLNLAINGRDSMPSGGILTIETANMILDETYTQQHEGMLAGEYVRIAVSDNGTGITPENLEKVFDPFFTTKKFGGGSGLGLSMVYGFAKQSNGHLTIYSEVDHGTTVNFYIPRFYNADAPGHQESETPDFKPGSARILVVEDNNEVRKGPVTIFRDQGYEVIEAENGDEAIKQLKSGVPFDLLFTDLILLSGMNGIEVATKAKQIQPGIKVLYTTGFAENAIKHNSNLSLGDMLINKPYRRVDLLEKVQNILDENNDCS